MWIEALVIIWATYLLFATLRYLAMGIFYRNHGKWEYWVEQHPYHLIANQYSYDPNLDRNPGAVLMGLLAVCIGMAGFFCSFAAVKYFYLWSLIAAGIGSYWAIAAGYWLYKNKKLVKSKFSQWWQRLLAWKNSWSPLELKQARESRRKLFALVTDSKQKQALKPILDNIDHLVKKELPRLLKRRTQLSVALKNAQEVIEKQKANGVTPGEELLLSQAKKDLDTLKDHLNKVDIKINLILAFIDLIQTQVCVIIDAVNAQMTDRVESLIKQVQEEVTLIRQSHEEIQALADKYHLEDSQARQAAAAEVAETASKLPAVSRREKVKA